MAKANILNQEKWKRTIEEFSYYEGSLSSYCKENNISKSQFHYYKKRLEPPDKTIFHAIKLNDAEVTLKATENNSNASKDIRIEIGKVNIYIPVNELGLLSTLVTELAKS